ncbi:ABC transporter permease [Halalkalibacter sp. AB-rgal2]|uniref:ABC transporter permease n=1 Tax=Halalkalibacter sp. AB-rgal2 TaxID=3242695 RepID=UPI00359E3BF2
MLKLIWNEWIKLFKKTGTYVMIGLLIVGVIAMGGILKYEDSNSSSSVNDNWQEELETMVSSDQEALDNIGSNNANLRMFYERQIALNEYHLQNDLAPPSEKHIWTFVYDAVALTSLAGLFTIIVAAGIVASEFSSGTIKFLLIRPISRTKLLLSKYLTVILFSLGLLAIVFLLSSLVGSILFGFPAEQSFHLAYRDGEVIERNIILHLIMQYLLYSIDIFMISTMAFMISSVFRNSSLAIGFSLFLLFMGSTVTLLLASRFEWAKYILFSNTDLNVYFDGVPPVDSMTLGFSIVMLLVYFLIFHVLAFTVFAKRDVSA